MSSFQTTEILFNSPALHSLKRDQLVKLCKIHSVKASGKNVELIERLKRVAEDLPKGSLSIGSGNHDIDNGDMEIDEAADNGGNNKENYADRKIGSTTAVVNPPRPSEQWEVMESIAECENEDSGSRNGTLRSIASNREFGTGGSKSSTISSIKALASSLGLKRSTSAKSVVASSLSEQPPVVPPISSEKLQNAHASGTRGDRFPPATDDELSKHAIPYTRLPVPSPNQIPQTDHFSDFSHFGANPPTPATLSKFDFNNREDTAPLPGHVLRPGAPAPNNARLSLGDARFSLGYGLATPRKSASGATTTIRLVSSSSMIGITNSPGPSTSTLDIENSSTPHLKPWNTAFDLVLGSPSGLVQGENVKIYPDLPMEDVLVSSTTVEPSQTLSDGFPHLSGAKSQAFVFGSPLPQHRVSNAQFQTAAASVLEEMNRRLLADGVEAVGPSLVSNLRPGAGGHLTPGTQKVYTDRQIKPLRKSFGAHAVQKEIQQKFEKAHQDQFDGMESIAGYLDRKNNSSLVGKAPVGTSLSIESVQVGKKRKSSAIDDGRQAPAKRPSTRVISNSRRTVPGGFGDEDEDEEAPVGKKPRVEFSGKDDTGAKEVDQSALEKSEKERDAIRRKLEMNRARRRSSAANGRASMGRGRVSVGRNSKLPPKQAASKSRFGFLSNAAKSIVKGVWGGGKKTPAVVPPKPVSKAPPCTTSTAKPLPSTGVTEAKAKVTPSGTQRKFSATDSGTSPRNRDVSNVGTMNSLGSVATAIHSSRSRSPLPSFAAPTKSSSVRSSATGTTSTRNSSVAVSSRVSRTSTTSATSSRVSSLGVRGTLDPNRVSSTTSSRLLAPTASSLAKAASLNRLKSDALNVPVEAPVASSPSSSKIFSKPLVVPKGSGLPSPVRSGRSQTVTREITVKQRSLSGRKPRISRSKVIAKLASQRNPSGRSEPSASTDYTGPSAVGLAAKRSSLGVGVHKAPRKSMGAARRSHIGVSGARSSEASVLLSAKKRARQSEYARRKSRAATGGAEPMKVDA
ncbi:hypothetical protein F5051DRAFT_365901 [Lentinula edodes]|nr:hypothetical protein F5051DRAFT_365901 [Lentinula edodes]